MPFEMDSTISIHAPPARGATIPGITYTRQNLISIHAPREGGDCSHTYQQEATQISIHAPCEGGDVGGIRSVRLCGDFNPRPPARGATQRKPAAGVSAAFQSTPPRKGGDADGDRQHHRKSISIHAPPRGGRRNGQRKKNKET